MEDNGIIDELLKDNLDGKPVNNFITGLVNVAHFRYPEERYFEIYFKTGGRYRSYRPIIKGIYFFGRGTFVRPWMEISYSPNLKFYSRTGEAK